MRDISLERSGTVEQIAGALEARILDGEIPPGTHLRESLLAERLGVSRNSMREAIRGLVPGRLVRHLPNRGFVVTRLTAEDVDDLFGVREVLEIGALRDRFALARDRLGEFEEILEDLTERARRSDWDGVFQADRRFHRLFVRLLGSPRLQRFHGEVYAELRLALVQADRLRGDADRLEAEHRAVLEPLRDGDRSATVQALRNHLRDAASELREHLATSEKEER